MRARHPDQAGRVERGGVRIYYEVFGAGAPTVLLMPTFPIVHSRMWKAQVPYLAHRYRVVAFDPRGNGRSDRPAGPEAYGDEEALADTLAVMEATGTAEAVFAALCSGVRLSTLVAARHPDRVLGLIAFAPGMPFIAPAHPHWNRHSFEDVLDTDEGWAKHNRHYMLRDFRGYVEWHSGWMTPEPHSTKLSDDLVAWGLDTTAETLITRLHAPSPVKTKEDAEALCRQVRCPVLVIHGDRDECQPMDRGNRYAELTGGRLVVLEGSGHAPMGRHPVRVNLLMSDFITSAAVRPRTARTTWHRALARPRRALFVSSSIGLGHIQRDLAIARELRALVPDLEIHWWAQHPAAQVLEAAGEIIHPQSHLQAPETAHWEEEATEHELQAFYAFRRLDEIFVANFMLFHDITRDGTYDLWIGDEAWEVDYFLHENPELKCAPYVWLTDVIGFLPVDPDGDPREAALCADYNAEMIEQRARYPRLRDLSLYVGEYEELPDASFGPGLPGIRAWARDWYTPVGYVLPFDPAQYRDPAALRRRLGYGTGYPLVFAAVGGTRIGRGLLGRVIDGFAQLRETMPEAQLVLIAGPRLDPHDLPDVPGMAKCGYVHNLFEHLACADAAIAQGGLTTTMELVATRRPFAYVPLRRHWEQQHHVDARLRFYGAANRLEYESLTPARVAETLRRLLAAPVRYREVPRDGARRAAREIAGLLGR
ncbi:MAG TPA: alpha/beta fold hydrolase [Gemmatimonadales bacterium]|nr:alpha/beta fold hydrolase [Gemmatimonadales bacterium]